MPFFSIIIPTLNSTKTLSTALESILNQNFNDFEILMMDGLSTDATLVIAQSFGDERIKISSEKDLGIYDAMNKGIKMADGEWLYFMGSDDKLYDNNVLATFFNHKQINHQKIIYGNVLIDGDAGWAKDGHIYDGEFTLPKLIEKNICHQAIFYKKTVFGTNGGFNIEYNVCADWDMNLRLWSTYSFHYVETIVAVFKGGNISYQIVNNYSDTEKWLTIIHFFNLKIISGEFSQFYKNIFLLSRNYGEKGKFFKSFLLKFISYMHKIRIQIHS